MPTGLKFNLVASQNGSCQRAEAGILLRVVDIEAESLDKMLHQVLAAVGGGEDERRSQNRFGNRFCRRWSEFDGVEVNPELRLKKIPPTKELGIVV